MKYCLTIICLFYFSLVFSQEEDFRDMAFQAAFVDADESDDEIETELFRIKSSHNITYANNLLFSHESGYYYKSFDLKIESSGKPEDSIYYTIDGSEPTRNSYLYGAKIPIQLPEDSTSPYRSYVLRARSFMGTIALSKIVSKTYLVFSDPDRRFSYPVISLITDPDNFFDNEIGIYVRGENYVSGNNWTGNYFMTGIDWERPVRIQYFTNSGEVVLDQDAGVRIHGGLQRTAPQKTLRLYARDEYGESTFSYKLLPQKEKYEYKRFLLRTSYGCWNSTIIKDPMAASLVKGLNFEVQDYRPVIVFLNGRYWGIQTIRDYFGQFHIADKYNVDKESVSLGNVIYAYEGTATKYLEVVQILDSAELSESEMMKEISSRMDMNSMINYHNAEIYLNNYDWPAGNRRWWCSTEYDKGKLGWFFYDLDASFSARGGVANDLLKQATVPSSAWPNPPISTKLLSSLLENSLFRNEFITRAAYIMNYHLHADTIIPKIIRVKAEYGLEMRGHLERWSLGSYESWESKIESALIGFARDRRKYVNQHYISKFGLSGTSVLTVKVKHPRRGQAYINAMPVPHTNSSGEYFNDVPIRLTAVPSEGFRFSHWEGPVHYTHDTISVCLSSDTEMIAVFELGGGGERFIKINELMAKNSSTIRDNFDEADDWIEIYNGGDAAFNLGGLYLTDDRDMPFKWLISPSCTDSVTVSAHGFKLFFADNQVDQGISHCNFKLNSSGETISLIKNNFGIPFILDSLTYNSLSSDVSWGRCTEGSYISTLFDVPTPGASNVTITSTVPKLQSRQFTIFPNPSSDQVNVFLESDESLFHRLTILSMSGSIVKTVEFYGSELKLDISDLSPGIYILGIADNPMLKLKLIIT